MRGTQFQFRRAVERQWIIPADAGNTHTTDQDHSEQEDHPRGCGEHYCHSVAVGTPMGSSPRMRGTLQATKARHDRDGIIPADAGNTLERQPY